jgi:hypothetical protein
MSVVTTALGTTGRRGYRPTPFVSGSVLGVLKRTIDTAIAAKDLRGGGYLNGPTAHFLTKVGGLRTMRCKVYSTNSVAFTVTKTAGKFLNIPSFPG